jgi:hypothetical protein
MGRFPELFRSLRFGESKTGAGIYGARDRIIERAWVADREAVRPHQFEGNLTRISTRSAFSRSR